MIRAMRRAMERAGRSCKARRLDRKSMSFLVPYDYQDRTTEAGPKTAWRGAAGRTSPGYRVMNDGSIRRA